MGSQGCCASLVFYLKQKFQQPCMAGVDAGRFETDTKKSPSKPCYAHAMYWSKRYQEKTFEPFDWYVKWEHLKELLSSWLSSESVVLIAGCGTSLVAEQMLSEGLASKITCVDQCAELIASLREKYKDKAAMEFEVADAANLPQDWSDRFDLVLDKALLDTVVAGRQGWASAEGVLQSLTATLKSSGRYVCISHARPAQRLPLLSAVVQDKKREISCHQVARPLDPPPDPKAKAGKAAKGAPDPSSMQAAATDQKDNVYHIYCCECQAEAPEPPPQPAEETTPEE
mmetsp:Transcript_48509/g.113699  ORF Transcript_48509/g.113699 Transcript_48509/m.113699 type:complete len:285 (+) Transcript_48509:21-875(+)